jgi:anhydro-N-acetylmuramic acid kinase
VTGLAVGLMSGTSLDGVDAALVRLTTPDTVELLAFHTEAYSTADRTAMLEAIRRGSARDLALLHVELGRKFADAAEHLLVAADVDPREISFVASHGQTVWHEPGAATLQLGDPSVIAEHLGCTVVSDFRSRDVAAGGQGAPLVPIADCMLFGDPRGGRALLNLGGMANVTWVPRRGRTDGALAFDTGPGVAVIDAVARSLDPGVPFDADGTRARRGRAHPQVLEGLVRHPYFAQRPPKSTGREVFGDSYATELVRLVRAHQGSDDDAVATAVALTTRSVAEAFERWLPGKGGSEVVVAGGGRRNAALMDKLGAALRGWTVRLFDDLFFDGDAKEAVAFAYLGWLALEGKPGNVPGATGAKGGRVLGRITPR